MITDLTTSMLYICPECSTTTLRTLSAFEIKKSGGLSLFCSNKSCRYDDVIINASKDKYKISIDCPICGEEHGFTLSKKTLWSKNFLILNCPQSGFGILFIGKDIEKLTTEYGIQSELIAGIVASTDEEYDELDILFEMVELINKCSLDKLIHCSCGSDDISINININSVVLSCKTCKKSIVFYANPETLTALANLQEIIIK